MSILAILSIILTAAALFGFVSIRLLRLPVSIGTMLLTVVASLGLLAASHAAPSLTTQAEHLVVRMHFADLILHGMLGLLLFAGSFLLELADLRSQKLAVGLLAVFGTLCSMAAVAAAMHALLPLVGLPSPWIECLFFGALISPTDPVAVLEMLHRVGVGPALRAQLAGESLFNDGIGAVLFLAVLEASQGDSPSIGHIAALLIFKAGGGLLLGIVLARIASELMGRVDSYHIEILLTLSLALGGYAIAEGLRVSAPLEAVAAGLALRQFNCSHPHGTIAHEPLERFWRVIDEIQNAVLFVLLGFEVLAIRFSAGSFASGAAAIVAVAATRLLVVGCVMQAVRLIRPRFYTSVTTLTWGGLRGGLSIALALSVPAALSRSWILASTYLVVAFSIIVQGGTLDLFLRGSGAGESIPE